MQERRSELPIAEVLTGAHNLGDFSSENNELTAYLKENALEEQREKTSTTHVLLDDSRDIIGYITLLNDSIRVANINEEDKVEGYSYGAYPAVKIGRLAVHKDYARKGLGTFMLSLSVSYIFDIHRYSGCRMVTVDAKKGAEGFYEKFGFRKTTVKGKDNETVKMYMDIAAFLMAHDNG